MENNEGNAIVKFIPNRHTHTEYTFCTHLQRNIFLLCAAKSHTGWNAKRREKQNG